MEIILMKCETCANYSTYYRMQDNGYIGVWTPISHCELQLEEENCEYYEKRSKLLCQ